MGRYVIHRLAQSVLALGAIVTVIFLMMHVVGDPVALMYPEGVPESQLAKLREQLGYAAPLHVQYFKYMSGVVRGDFGMSQLKGMPAMEAVLSRLNTTLLLASCTVLLSIVFGLSLGVIAACRPGGVLDKIVTVISLTSIAVPDFWFALLLVLVFSVQLGWLPTSGYGEWNNLVLPVIALMIKPAGRIAQMTRASMSDQLQRGYGVTAASKGLRRREIIIRHMLKNAAIAIVTLIGAEIVTLVSGAVIIETIFAWPGIGLLLIDSIRRRDLAVVEATVTIIGVMVIVINLLVDLSYGALDPTIKYQ